MESRLDDLGALLLKVPPEALAQTLERLRANPLVEYAEPNFAAQAFDTPSDPLYPAQAGSLGQIQAPAAWDVTKGQGVVVAVVDTGVDAAHPDLQANIWQNPGETGTDGGGNDMRTNGIDDDGNGYVDDWQGWDFVAGDNLPADDNGHGTHIAGVAAAGMDNGQGMTGVAPGAKIMALKALDSTGNGTYAAAAEAILYAVHNGARVINLGFGGTGNSQALQDATDYAYAHGVLVVAAAGNSGTRATYYPAANQDVVAVSAVDEALNSAPFSTYGDHISLSAPGAAIYGTVPGGDYRPFSGTSMSAAQVSGVAALLASLPQFPTAAEVREALLGSALDLGAPGRDIYFGYGLVQALNAINYVPAGGTPSPTPSPTPTSTIDPSASPTPTPGDGVHIIEDAPNAVITNYTTSCDTRAYTGALGGTPVPAIQVDNAVSGPISLGPGFEFWMMGARYTQVWVSSNGWLSFNEPTGSGDGPSLVTNDLDNQDSGANTIYNTNARPILAPLWDELNAGGGVASYQTAGAAPDRTFTFEWWNYQWGGGTASTRIVLHERTGIIDFLYYPNDNSAGDSASIGITASGSGVNTYLSASAIDNCPPTWSSTTETTNLSARLPQGTAYTFTPPQDPASPTMQAATNVTTISETLNWTDNSSDEVGFAIYTSTDGINYSYVARAAANAASMNVTGLANSANNFWQVYPVTEGALSAPLAPLNAPTALTFPDVRSTSATLNWADNTSNETGYLVYNSTDGINFILVATTAADATSYTATGLTPGTVYAWRVLAINAGSLSAAAAGTITTNTPPVVTITAPDGGSTFGKNTPITFTGTALDGEDGDISAGLLWYSNLTGPFGTGASLTVSDLPPGTHTITAQSTDSNGDTGSASITVTVTHLSGPHGDYNGSTDACAQCHRAHSAQGSTYLTTDPDAVTTGDDFCLSCHPGVSTHSNKDWGGAAEAPFEVRCIQCHDAHGGPNLFGVRTEVMTSVDPLTKAGPVTFTALTGANSFDDGSTNALCVVCHSKPPMSHTGGVDHVVGLVNIDYTGRSCVACHAHNADTSAATLDGFMPIRNSNP